MEPKSRKEQIIEHLISMGYDIARHPDRVYVGIRTKSGKYVFCTVSYEDLHYRSNAIERIVEKINHYIIKNF